MCRNFDGVNVIEWMIKIFVNYLESNWDLRRKMKYFVFVFGFGIFIFFVVDWFYRFGVVWMEGRMDGLMLIDWFMSEWLVGLLLVRCIMLGCELVFDGYVLWE